MTTEDYNNTKTVTNILRKNLHRFSTFIGHCDHLQTFTNIKHQIYKNSS